MQPIEIKFNRFSYLIPIPFILFLMWVFYWFTIAEPDENFTGSVKVFLVVTAFVEIIGLFLTIYFFKQFVKPPVIFRMDDQGIVYNPAGVSTGLIGWNEISDVNETNMKVVRNGAPVYQTVLAVKVKEPQEFRKKYNIGLRHLMKYGSAMYGGDVMIESKVLGKHYDTVKGEMRRRVPLSFQHLSDNPASRMDLL